MPSRNVDVSWRLISRAKQLIHIYYLGFTACLQPYVTIKFADFPLLKVTALTAHPRRNQH